MQTAQTVGRLQGGKRMKRNTKKRRNRYYTFLAIMLSLLMVSSCSSPAASQTDNTESKAEEITETKEETSEKTEAKEETAEKAEAKKETADKSEAVWKEQEALKAAEPSDIISISYAFYGEEGETAGTEEDRDDIEDIYLRLCNISLGAPVNMGIEDASLFVTVKLADQELNFHFEADYVDLGNSLYEAKHVDSLRTYLWDHAFDDADDADDDKDDLDDDNDDPDDDKDDLDDDKDDLDDDADDPDDNMTEETAKAEIMEEISEEANDLEDEDYKVFASESLNFSFLYDSDHTAYLTESGTAQLAINGDESRTGLFVSVMDAENMPSVDQILEEEAFNTRMHYQNALIKEAERQDFDIQGHQISGIMFTYSNPSGQTILGTYFVEVRDGKYIFFKTRGIYGSDGDELVAMGAALVSMKFDAGAYGASDAVSGSIPEDEFSPTP
jgi:hypothetical protein